jgi:bacterioferritin-associated ferredoxin
MIVCICRGVSDRRIRHEIEKGASSIDDLRRCGIGDQCGSCHSVLQLLLSEAAAAVPCANAVCACAHSDSPTDTAAQTL